MATQAAGGASELGAAEGYTKGSRRVRVACQRCHSRKIRCSGTHPCQQCVTKGRECTFDLLPSSIPPPGPTAGPSSQPITDGQSSSNSARRDSDYEPAPKRRRSLAADEESADPLRAESTHTAAPVPSTSGDGTGLVKSPKTIRAEPVTRAVARQPFFRWLGPTAIISPASSGVPFKKHSVTLIRDAKAAASDTETSDLAILAASALSGVPQRRNPGSDGTGAWSNAPTRASSPTLLCDQKRVPPPSTIEVFYTHVSNHLPFLDRPDFDARVQDRTLSEGLLCAIGAISERVAPTPDSPGLAEAWADRAKSLLVPHLALPTVDLAYALLLLAYHEFAANRDSGLWMWSGMAIRCATDLGLHMPFRDPDLSPENLDRTSVLRARVFWSIFCLDRFISMGTGRRTTIPLESIQISYPVRQVTAPTYRQLPDPFPFLCRLLSILGTVSDLLNEHLQNKASDPSILQQRLSAHERSLSEFLEALPPELHFNVHNFRAFSEARCGQVFVLLNTWYQATFLSVSNPALLYPSGNFGAPPTPLLRALSRSSAITIGDMVAFSDLIDPATFLYSPFLSQPLLLAGRAALHLLRSPSDDLRIDNASHSVALRRTFELSLGALIRMRSTWAGVQWLCTSLADLAEEGNDVTSPLVGGASGGARPESAVGDAAGGVNIKLKDRGVLRGAKINQDARDWLEETLKTWSEQAMAPGGEGQGSVDARVGALGLSLSGIIDQPQTGTVSLLPSSNSGNRAAIEPISWPVAASYDRFSPKSTRNGGIDASSSFMGGFGFPTGDGMHSLAASSANGGFPQIHDFLHVFESGLTAQDAFDWLLPSQGQQGGVND